MKPGRPSSVVEVEYHVLNFLIHGDAANLNGLAELSEKMHASLRESDGEPFDPVAYKRFQKGVENVEKQLTRLLEQRARKLKE